MSATQASCADADEAERTKILARNSLESDAIYFGRLLREETEAGRIGDVAGKVRAHLHVIQSRSSVLKPFLC